MSPFSSLNSSSGIPPWMYSPRSDASIFTPVLRSMRNRMSSRSIDSAPRSSISVASGATSSSLDAQRARRRPPERTLCTSVLAISLPSLRRCCVRAARRCRARRSRRRRRSRRAPVMYFESGPARKTTRLATSSTSPKDFIGICLRIPLPPSFSMRPSTSSVGDEARQHRVHADAEARELHRRSSG